MRLESTRMKRQVDTRATFSINYPKEACENAEIIPEPDSKRSSSPQDPYWSERP